MKTKSPLFILTLVALLLTSCNGSSSRKRKSHSSGEGEISEHSEESEESLPLPPAEYYESIDDSMSGTSLLNALHSIIDTSDVEVDYNWSRFEAADQDPNNQYNVILIYARTSKPKTDATSGGQGWNREHTFPKSKMSSEKAKKDNHIIFASDCTVNTARSNIKMGIVDGGSVITDSYGNQTTCRVLKSSDETKSLFDPCNRARGIVARSTMYAAAMYNYNPLVNFESIETLLKWHLEYPVDLLDFNRNETVHKNQHNRNPFVDHPDYACRIWGGTNAATQSLCSQ